MDGMTLKNPFLNEDFAIDWTGLSAGHVVPDMQLAIGHGNAALQAIRDIADGGETFENTFLALENASMLVSSPWQKVGQLTAVNDHPELRKAHLEVLPAVSAFFAAIPLDQGLYAKLKHFAASGGVASLNPVQKRFVEETIKDFEDAGASLDEPTRNRLKEIESALAEKTKAFSDNVLDSTNAFQLVVDSKDDLAGLPESFVEAARESALAKGIGTAEDPKYRFTLQMPSYIPAMRFLDSDDIRRQLFEAFTKVGHAGEHENGDLIKEILMLRREKANLLGRDIFPDWALSRRMAKDGATAMAFVEDLHARTKEAFDREVAELEAYKAAKTGTETAHLNQWEGAYWAEKLRREQYDFDEELLRPYFPMQSVMDGMFSLVEKIFGIRVKEVTSEMPPAWHPEVQAYAIHDVASGRHMGTFYTDWFPRESKQGGAWMNYMITGTPVDGVLSPHLGQMAGNLTPPVGGKPALLNHRDVETVFHEFGHLIHHLLSEVEIRSLAGVNVAWDFVELPSQIMENWCWERDSLDLFARHYETGDPIPEDLFQKMRKSRNFRSATMQMRQLQFGRMDLSLHMSYDPDGDVDLDAFIKQALEGYLAPVNVEYPSSVRGFNHLFSSPTGYAAGYYSYKWAEVLDADAFTRFAREGIMNPETGMAFRRCVLAKGNSEEAGKLFHDFMGRDPDPMALLRRLGLVA